MAKTRKIEQTSPSKNMKVQEELGRAELKQPEFGYLPKDMIQDLITDLVSRNQDTFKQYFTLCKAMESKVVLSEPDPTETLFEK